MRARALVRARQQLDRPVASSSVFCGTIYVLCKSLPVTPPDVARGDGGSGGEKTTSGWRRRWYGGVASVSAEAAAAAVVAAAAAMVEGGDGGKAVAMTAQL